MKQKFLLDSTVHYLNHGAFGAVPRPVYETFLSWQRRIESQPVTFFLSELAGHFEKARSVLGEFVGAHPGDLGFVPNSTYGVNLVARSLKLGPGDEVLTTNHEYGACDKAWRFLSGRRGFSYVRQPVPLGLSAEERAACIREGITGKTRVIFLSEITSPTALRLPVAEICRTARERGILTVIDGAHCVGQIPLELNDLGADFYVSNAHKWLCSPKVSAFLYARREVQELLQPLVISWGWGGDSPIPFGSSFLDNLQWPGTANVAAYLSIPAAIEFQRKHHWPGVRESCHEMLTQALAHITAGTGKESPYRSSTDYVQMGIAPLPKVDPLRLHDRLLKEYRVEVPITEWEGSQFVRVSVQGYNTQDDLRALERGLRECLDRC